MLRKTLVSTLKSFSGDKYHLGGNSQPGNQNIRVKKFLQGQSSAVLYEMHAGETEQHIVAKHCVAGDLRDLTTLQFVVSCVVNIHVVFKSLLLAYKVLNGTPPIYLNALAKAYVTTRSKDCRRAVPTPRLRQSRLFSRVVPMMME